MSARLPSAALAAALLLVGAPPARAQDAGAPAAPRAPVTGAGTDRAQRPSPESPPAPAPRGPRPRPAPDPRRAPTATEPTAADPEAMDGGVPLADAGAAYARPLLDGAPEPDGSVPPDAGPPPEPDAGPPPVDAGPPPPPEPADSDADDVPWTTLLNELLFERAERRRAAEGRAQAAPSQPQAAPTTVVQTPRDVDVNIVGCNAQPELFGLGFPERRVSTFGLLLLVLLTILAGLALERARRPLPGRGLLPRVLGAAHLAARLATVVILIMLTSRLLPAWLRPALLLSIAAVAVTIGFGAVWTVLPDVVGGIILVTERRLRPGLFITGDGFRGTLEQIGPRLTTLRALDGTTLTIPNRRLVKSRLQSSDRRWHEIEVELSVPPQPDAARVRRAIEDAVLSSPHIPPAPALTVSRDPAHPERWRVSSRLVDARFAAEFEGQLLERVEEALAANGPPDDVEPPAEDG